METTTIHDLKLKSRLLPNFLRKEIDATTKEWQEITLQQLDSFSSDVDPEKIDVWLDLCFTDTAFVYFTIEQRAKILQFLYTTFCCDRYYQLAYKVYLAIDRITQPYFDQLNVVLPWRPLYEVVQRTRLSHSKLAFPTNEQICIQYLRAIESVVRFFPTNATEEILAETQPLLNPQASYFYICYLLRSEFLPVNHGKEHLWLSDMMKAWSMFTSYSYDTIFLKLFCRLSKYSILSDWAQFVPLIFHKAARHLTLPEISSNFDFKREISDFSIQNFETLLQPDSSSYYNNLYAILIVNLLSTSARANVREHLSKLLHLMEYSTISPDDDPYQNPFDFLEQLIYVYAKRIRLDRTKVSTLTPFSASDNDWFCKAILKNIIPFLYSNQVNIDSLYTFVQIYPSVVIPHVLDSVQRMMSSDHLRTKAASAMSIIVPTVYSTEIMLDTFKLIMMNMDNEIGSTDENKSSFIFRMFYFYGLARKIDDTLSGWALTFIRKCIAYFMPTEGQESEPSLSLMSNALPAITQGVDVSLRESMIQILLDEDLQFLLQIFLTWYIDSVQNSH